MILEQLAKSYVKVSRLLWMQNDPLRPVGSVQIIIKYFRFLCIEGKFVRTVTTNHKAILIVSYDCKSNEWNVPERMLVVIQPLCGNTRYGNAAVTSSLARCEVMLKVESMSVVTSPTNAKEHPRFHSCFNVTDWCNVLTSGLLFEVACSPRSEFFAGLHLYWIARVYAISSS